MIFRKSIDFLLIILSGALDDRYYLRTYDDVRRADVIPLKHYLNWGWKEGRNPSAAFNTAYYLQTNPDVRTAGINPLAHYLRYGKKEGRLPKPGFLPQQSFVNSHPIRRVIRAAARKFFRVLPLSILQRQRLKAFVFQHFPQLFNLTKSGSNSARLFDQVFTLGNLIDLVEVQPAASFNQRIAVHMHIFYSDLIPEFAGYSANIPFKYDLYISVVSEDARSLCKRAFEGQPNVRKLTIEQVPNRGRDLCPFFCVFGSQLKQYDILGHFHTKKSLYNQGGTLGWREYLLSGLLGNRERIQRIFSLLSVESPYGIVYPQTYNLVPSEAHTWLANRSLAGQIQERLGFEDIPKGYFDFPAGSMFWARKDALRPLFEAGFALEDFPEENGQTDGTLAHTLERFLGISTINQGFKIAILRDELNYSWSSWRLENILQRPYSDLKGAISDSSVKLIGFDVFDTLLCRPLIDPEATKKIVARCSSADIGALYLRFRAIAESQARALKSSDVGLDETYHQLQLLSGLQMEDIANLRMLEENVEKNVVRPRTEVIRLFQTALQSNKTTIIITDTSLPQSTVEDMLHSAGVDGWDNIMVSNTVGVRKETGELYDHLLTQYALKDEDFLMIGDNERSDYQIPLDRGGRVVHILRPTETARGMPRLSALVNILEKRANLDEELTIGPIILRNFSKLVYQDLDYTSLFEVTPENIGYSLVGPLLVSFSQWLLCKAREDAVDRLYFLSREGRLMQAVYDAWTADLENVPRSEYLVVSRRCSSMAALSSFDDILEIASTTYFPNTLGKLLKTRYGISPSADKWKEISRAVNLGPDSIIEVQDKKIGRLEAVLAILHDEILAKAASEKVGLLQQLEKLGIQKTKNPGVVDVGYGGSVQGHLNRILGEPVHGYYLLTEDRSRQVSDRYGVHIRGCFGENIIPGPENPLMFRNSFELEKLLSSNDAQIEFYQVENGRVVDHFRPLSRAEIEPAPIRDGIRAGALKYATELVEIRRTLLPDFKPSKFVASLLMDAFLTNQSAAEKALLSSIILDDYYCGRDLVA